MPFWSKLFGRGTSEHDPKDAFATEVEAIARDFDGFVEVRYEPIGFTLELTSDDGASHSLQLGKLFAETRELSPEQRGEHVRAFFKSVRSPEADPQNWEEARSRLLPMLRPCSHLLSLPCEPDQLPIHRVFAPFLLECVGLDTDAAVKLVSPLMLEAWSVGEADVFATARENLTVHIEKGNEIESFDSNAAYPIWHVARDDSYEPSRLALPGWLASFASRVQGRPVAIVPERSTLIIGGDADDRCLQRLIEIAEREYRAAPRSISPALYTVDEAGAVIPLVLSDAHPLAEAVDFGHLMQGAIEYAEQKCALDQVMTEDVFVASLELVEEDGVSSSYTVWSKGVASLLPRADEVALAESTDDENPQALLVEWSDLLAAAPDCLVQEAGLEPPRWRTKEWPSEDALRRLRNGR